MGRRTFVGLYEWREDQKERTREILSDITSPAFYFDIGGVNKGYTLDHLDGRYGYIRLKDAVIEHWSIYDYETDEHLQSFKECPA